MIAFLRVFGIVPGWVWAGLLAACFARGVVVTGQRDAALANATQIQGAWDADTARRTAAALIAEQAARAAEKQMTEKVQKVSQAYEAEKNRRAVADRAAADSLRRLEAVLSAGPGGTTTDPATTGSADDDPRDGIIAECAGALVRLDHAYGALASQTTGLQRYAREVCVTPSPATPPLP